MVGVENASYDQEVMEARRNELTRLAAWAAEVLADPRTVVLDTETTGLHGPVRIVDLAVVTPHREILLDTLINPSVPIPREATDVHHITDEMVVDAPQFADVVVELAEVLTSRRVVIYNVTYDTGVLRGELGRLLVDRVDASTVVSGWMCLADYEDAMVPYSNWVGERNGRRGDYTWQKLGGGHRALEDCYAVVDRLEEMAASA